MNEDQSTPENVGDEWQAPPPPEKIEPKEEPEMSEVSTLANIFFEPGRTFEDLRKKPRFILAFIILAVLTTGFAIAFQQKIGDEKMRRFIAQENEKSPGFADAPPERQKQAVDIGMAIQKGITYGFPILLGLVFLIGGLLYWLGGKIMGGAATFMQSLSVFIYSSFPPWVLASIANFIILMFKSSDEIDIATSSRGLVKANPSAFIGGKDMPVLTTLISSIDIFAIWGIILAGIGLHKVGKLSKGSAFGVVLVLTLIGITFRVLQAVLTGNPS